MPQIAQLSATYASQIFWLLLTFGLVFFVVGRGMVPKVMSTIDRRDRSVADDLAAADAARAEADAQEEAWRTRENANREAAQAKIAEARAAAARASEARLAAAGADTDRRVAEAEGAIAEQTRTALADIEGVAAEAARAIVGRLTGAEIADADARAAVQQAMARG